MAHTLRKALHGKYLRTPKYRWKLLDTQSRGPVVTDWDDKPIAALKELHHAASLRMLGGEAK